MIPPPIRRNIRHTSHLSTTASSVYPPPLNFFPAKVSETIISLLALLNSEHYTFREWPGEALNVDLNDFVGHLYAMIPFIGIPSEGENADASSPATVRHASAGKLAANGTGWVSQAQVLFHTLHLVFFHNIGGTPPAWRAAAFAKRLLTAALHWDPTAAIRAVEFVAGLVRKDPKLEALLTTEDRSFDGMYHPEVDDPQLCHPFGTSFFELALLRNHIDSGVRDAARTLTT